jgi:hypothetical protein
MATALASALEDGNLTHQQVIAPILLPLPHYGSQATVIARLDQLQIIGTLSGDQRQLNLSRSRIGARGEP